MHFFSKIVIQPRVSRSAYFKFKQLCHAHSVPVERAIEELMKDALERAGVETAENGGVKSE